MLLLESIAIITFYVMNVLLHASHLVTTSKVMDMPHNDDLHYLVEEMKKRNKSEGDI